MSNKASNKSQRIGTHPVVVLEVPRYLAYPRSRMGAPLGTITLAAVEVAEAAVVVGAARLEPMKKDAVVSRPRKDAIFVCCARLNW